MWNKWYPNVPRVELETKHIRNCKLVTNRSELLKVLPKHAVVAEIGVERGLFSQEIFEICKPKKLILVDTWTNEEIEKECKINLERKPAEFNKMLSVDYLSSAEPKSIDWIYIDTDHTYKTTMQELKLASKALKDGGMICGHDYTSVSSDGLRKYGVVEAVNAFCVEHDYEFLYLTNETARHLSFCIRKIG